MNMAADLPVELASPAANAAPLARGYRRLTALRVLVLALLAAAIVGALLLDFTTGPSGLALDQLIATLGPVSYTHLTLPTSDLV